MPTLLATETFERWGLSHITILVLAVLTAVAVVWAGKHLHQHGRFRLARVLAAIVAVEMVAEYTWRLSTIDDGCWQDDLPLHFCSVMAFFSILALWWRQRWACATVYFGVLTASIQGLLTPALTNPFPDIRFLFFFFSHSLLLVVAVAIPGLLGWRGRGWDVVRSIAIMDLYLLCIIPVNVMLGTNYGYTQGSPVEGCILDYLGPAPWYYVWLQIPAFLLFYLMLQFVRKRKAGEGIS